MLENILKLTNRPKGRKLQASVHAASLENASVQAGCGVHWFFRDGAWVNLETGQHGIRWLVAQILAQHGAFSPETGMRSDEVAACVRAANGFERYPDETVAQTLARDLRKSGQVAAYRMTSAEDWNRTCKTPRCRYYLLATE